MSHTLLGDEQHCQHDRCDVVVPCPPAVRAIAFQNSATNWTM
jgi:hypothetical protein